MTKEMPSGLSDAVDESSKVNRNLGLTFISFCIFLLVFNISVEDVMILLPDTFRLQIPIVDVKLTLKGLYIITPLLMLFFHYNLLQNITHHDAKLELWSHEVTKRWETMEPLEIIREKEKYIYPFLYNYSILQREEICNPKFKDSTDVVSKRAYLKECLNSRLLIQLFLFILPLIVLSIMFLQTIKFASLTLHIYYILICACYYFFIVIRFSRKLSLEKIDSSDSEEKGKDRWGLKYIRKQLKRSIIPQRGDRYKIIKTNWKDAFRNLPRVYSWWTFVWRFYFSAWLNIIIVAFFFWNLVGGFLFISKTWRCDAKIQLLYEGNFGFRYYLKVSGEKFDNPTQVSDYFSYHFYSQKSVNGQRLLWTDLSNSRLNEFDFSNVHFYKCNMDNTDFYKSKFSNCKWTPAKQFSRLQKFNQCFFDLTSFSRLMENYPVPKIDTIDTDLDFITLLLGKRDTVYVSTDE